ncbi:prepilin-type N-terminal cleavage/methylation domain-containing protein [Desulforudis sp. 1088]|uniref:prepilin-type N-terminal cleavage/methylation domain-containing protein n=1 Tax=unclassified Candidatus Desulforudis TaxID=2635950 RepID=UPI003CE487F6
MFTRLCHLLKNRKGFTLVELMIVVVIIGILVAIAVPVYNNVSQTAERRAVEANLRTIDGAIMQFQAANNGTNPTDINALVPTYLQAVPAGPGTATYTVGGTPLRGQVSGTVGGTTLTNASLPIAWP